MSKLAKPTKPLGVGRGYGFSSVPAAKPPLKVGIKLDKTGSTRAIFNDDGDNDHKSVRKKIVKSQEEDTLKRRKLALSRDQVKINKISPVSKADGMNKQPNLTRRRTIKASATPNNQKTPQGNEPKTKLTSKLNFVISNKTTKEANGSVVKVPNCKSETTKDSLQSASHETKSNISRLKVKFDICTKFT